jgi:ubiquinone/menaquinone biosynthesis C-methylase UbiE/uncharacterized protein YbaR (Trm112 family)
MYESTLEWLICPSCYDSNLSLNTSHLKGEEVMDGTLVCQRCNATYPIKDGIPQFIRRSVSSNEIRSQIRNANIQFYDSTAINYEAGVDQREHQSEFNQNRIESIIKSLSDKTRGSSFLDVGCGTGNLLKYGRKHFARAIGADVSVEMLKKAREKGCEVVQAEALNLPFKCDTFNVVSIFSVLHHLYDYKPFFDEAERVLKSGGFLYTDWDPVKQPKINENQVSWKIFEFLKCLYKPFRILKHSSCSSGVSNIRELEPDVKKMAELAEYHNLGFKEQERGIDIEMVEKILVKKKFVNIHPSFHWAGRTINQIPLPSRIRFMFLKFQDTPVERFLENVMIVAQKG